MIVVDKSELERVQNKYKGVNPKDIERDITDKCKYYSSFNSDKLEGMGFENGKKLEFIDRIKEFVLLLDSNFKGIEKGETVKQDKEILTEEKVKDELNLCYEDVLTLLKDYCELKEEDYHLIAIWLIGTYIHKEFNTYPFLFLNAMRGSGKTRLLKILSYLQNAGNGDILNNLSESVVFRTAYETGLIFDEFEQIGGKDKQTLRELLNAAYKKGGKVKRMKKVKTLGGEKQVVEEFELYTPVAMANIWGMDEVLGDRCITLILEKSNNPYITKKIEDFDTNPLVKSITTRLCELKCSLCSVVTEKKYITEWNNYIRNKYPHYTLNTLTTLTTLTTQNDNLLENNELMTFFNIVDEANINGRNLELFFPLLVTSKLINNDNFLKTVKIAKEMVDSKKTDELSESKDVSFIDYISKVPELHTFEYIHVKEITNGFRAFLGDTDDADDKWLNVKWVGRALKRLNLATSKRRISSGIEVTLNITKAKDKLKIFKSEQKNG